jgi:hypothetical protein
MDKDVEDNFDGGHKAGDSVPSRTDKANKRRECIKKLALSQCAAAHVPDGLENLEDFDLLDGRDVARFITHQYYVIHKSVSGDHVAFEDRVGSKSYLLYFHNNSSSIASSAGIAENESLAMPRVVLLDMETLEEDFCEDSDNAVEQEWASTAGVYCNNLFE